MRVEKDFAEFLGLLNKHKVRYCIVGAFAVGFYGYPRYTKDMDIFVEPTLENGEKIVNVLNEFGFKGLNVKAGDFAKKGMIIQLGYEPIRVDLVTSITGCSFSQVWKTKNIGQYGQYKAFFIDPQELIKNKKLVNRNQDRIDLELLQRRLNKTKK